MNYIKTFNEYSSLNEGLFSSNAYIILYTDNGKEDIYVRVDPKLNDVESKFVKYDDFKYALSSMFGGHVITDKDKEDAISFAFAKNFISRNKSYSGEEESNYKAFVVEVKGSKNEHELKESLTKKLQEVKSYYKLLRTEYKTEKDWDEIKSSKKGIDAPDFTSLDLAKVIVSEIRGGKYKFKDVAKDWEKHSESKRRYDAATAQAEELIDIWKKKVKDENLKLDDTKDLYNLYKDIKEWLEEEIKKNEGVEELVNRFIPSLVTVFEK